MGNIFQVLIKNRTLSLSIVATNQYIFEMQIELKKNSRKYVKIESEKQPIQLKCCSRMAFRDTKQNKINDDINILV